jgi:hypothetical protein
MLIKVSVFDAGSINRGLTTLLDDNTHAEEAIEGCKHTLLLAVLSRYVAFCLRLPVIDCYLYIHTISPLVNSM